ncbi:hypothetical protein FQF96_27850 [Escherichia coli]|nr:hypothetical protein [Escherichia coli]
MAGEPCKTASGTRVYVTVRASANALSSFSEKVVLKSCNGIFICFRSWKQSVGKTLLSCLMM